MPLFVLAVLPVMLRCQYYGMSEIEAATRASGAQIILAKLILAGGKIYKYVRIRVYLYGNCRLGYADSGYETDFHCAYEYAAGGILRIRICFF